jgi:hypothetical protein
MVTDGSWLMMDSKTNGPLTIRVGCVELRVAVNFEQLVFESLWLVGNKRFKCIYNYHAIIILHSFHETMFYQPDHL